MMMAATLAERDVACRLHAGSASPTQGAAALETLYDGRFSRKCHYANVRLASASSRGRGQKTHELSVSEQQNIDDY
jgi:hypothetical protein